ncbi:MAG TPA: hypothetical protein VFI25_07180 [Planctomycetota bacterium]|jgi:hypothetical protein|nr:hypothetical protein [Planctomycetota bacterium]
MSRPTIVLATALVLGGLGGAAASLRLQGVPNGIPDLAGQWAGRVQFTEYDLSDSSSSSYDRKSCTFVLLVTQTGANLAMQLAPSCPSDDSTPAILLTGKVGNRHFWAYASSSAAGEAEGEILLSGKVSGSGARLKMKGIGIAVDDSGSECEELRFSASRLP